MINGAHSVLYSNDAGLDREFLREFLDLPTVDIGHGWLIFAMPPAEMAVHPAVQSAAPDSAQAHGRTSPVELYFMCDDLQSTIDSIRGKGGQCTEVQQENWGIRTSIALPSGGRIGLYQPSHPTALNPKK
jgi:hypothetical protein